MRVLSLGWGVQSWTLAAMSALGEIPKLDAAVHSDTRHERATTYAFAKEWTPWLEAHGIPVYTVSNQNYGGTEIVIKENEVQIPAFTSIEGSKGSIRRQCTKSWKIRPLRQLLQRIRGGQPVELWLGISADEWSRAKDADVKYIKHTFPLLDMDFTRQRCLDWLKSMDLPSPGKSSCVFCPFLNKAAWQDMRANHPEDWQEAIVVDESIRNARLPGELFVHSKRVPLALAVPYIPDTKATVIELLSSDDTDAECDSGHCFL